MTARHATLPLAIELAASAGARELTLRDLTGLGDDRLILDLRPSARSSPLTAMAVEVWSGATLGIGTVHLTATQLRAIEAGARAAAQEAEGRG